jgi:sulfite exporter TauE/SafE
MVHQLTEGFLLGLATGTACLATCGPIYAPFLMQYDRGLSKSVLALLEISAGRFLTYALVGAVAGLLGSGIPLDKKVWFTAAAYLLLSVFLIVTSFRTRKREKCCTKGPWGSLLERPLLLGIFTGINICPSFLIALTKAVDLSGPLAGAALFIAFFFGTSIFLLPLSFLGFFGAKKYFRSIARFSALLIGVWFITQAAVMVYNELRGPEIARIDPGQVMDVLDNSPAFILAGDSSTVKDFRAQLSHRKNASVTIVGAPEDLPAKGVVFVGQETVADQHLESHPLRTPGRFIIVLPEFSGKPLDRPQIEKLIGFLSFYQFKVDPDSGSIFVVPQNIFE